MSKVTKAESLRRRSIARSFIVDNPGVSDRQLSIASQVHTQYFRAAREDLRINNQYSKRIVNPAEFIKGFGLAGRGLTLPMDKLKEVFV